MAWVRYSHASISARRPRALGVCDRCGFVWEHYKLSWQFQWQGPKLQNIRLLVCPTCLDAPQEGLRTIIIPPDPLPIYNPRPENYTNDDNPVSTVGSDLIAGYGANIGTTSNLAAAFDGNTSKTLRFSAIRLKSVNGLANYVGKNWAAQPGNLTAPTVAHQTYIQSYNITSFAAYAPSDAPFIGGGASVAYKFQGSSDGVTYTDLVTGNTAGTNAETLTGTSTSATYYQYHRIIFTGDGTHSFGIAQLSMTGSPFNPTGVA